MGREHARRFGAEGAAMVVNDTGAERDGTGSDPAVIEAVATELENQGVPVAVSSDDVTTVEGANGPSGSGSRPGAASTSSSTTRGSCATGCSST
jgi:NAD(P)-dependent dehydrogenase (short-subunit alcohol dehydrogenase family)